jgi:hypothetical protein
MSANVRAICPGCQKVLRIPAEWADRPVRCKKCGAVVHAKPQADPPAAAPQVMAARVRPAAPPAAAPAAPLPLAIPVQPAAAEPAPLFPPEYVPPQQVLAQPHPAPAAFGYTDNPLAFEPLPIPRKYRRRSGVGRVLWPAFALLLAAVLIAGVVAGGFYAYPHLKPLWEGSPAGTAAQPEQPHVGPAAGSPLAAASTPFPRRMLVMHVSKYLYCNALTAGKGVNTPDHVYEVARRLAFDWRVPQDPGNNQLFVLSDTAPRDARPMLKPIIRETYRRFCETSREQDRVFLYFGGHAVERGGAAYLVPTDGDLDDPDSLLPLDDFWAALRDCKAHQKVVVFDVCRLNEDGDTVRPGSEPMTPALEAKLLDAPAGVRVVVTCSAGQNALEFRRTPGDFTDVAGSLFLSALRHVADRGKAKGDSAPAPDDPLPIDRWLAAAAARMKEVAAATGKPPQTPKLAGSEPSAAVAANPGEPPAPRFDLPAPPPGLPPAEVARITARLKLEPLRVRADRATEEEPIENLYPFDPAVMAPYLADATADNQFAAEAGKHPVRKAALDTLEAIRKHWEMTRGDDATGEGGLLTEFSGKTSDALKQMILARQEQPARAILDLQTRVEAMEALAGELEKEPSKFWRATFRYAQAQAQARLAFLHEYNYALGNIRTDTLPDLDESKGHVGLQLVSVERMRSRRDVKEIADAARELFAQIEAEHPGTPWAILARRDRAAALGLEWRPYSAGGQLQAE